MRIGLALGGGGARALAHIGVIRKLEELRIKIDFIAGTSMGAVVGALYSLTKDIDYVEKAIKELLKRYEKEILSLKNYAARSSVEEKKLFLEKSISFVKDLYLWNLRIVKPYLVEPKPFFRVFKGLFKQHKFKDCHIPFLCIAVDLLKGEVVVLKEGSLFKAIAASCALPGIFPPFKTKDSILADGGVLMPLPAKVLKTYVDFIIGVAVDEDFVPPQNLKNILDILFTVDRVRYKKIIEDSRRFAHILLLPKVSHYIWCEFDNIDGIIAEGERVVAENRSILYRMINKYKCLSILGIKPKSSKAGY